MTGRQSSSQQDISPLSSPDFSQGQEEAAVTDFKIPTHGETKSSFQDSEEFRNLISQLNQTLENLKYQDKIYKRGDTII